MYLAAGGVRDSCRKFHTRLRATHFSNCFLGFVSTSWYKALHIVYKLYCTSWQTQYPLSLQAEDSEDFSEYTKCYGLSNVLMSLLYSTPPTAWPGITAFGLSFPNRESTYLYLTMAMAATMLLKLVTFSDIMKGPLCWYSFLNWNEI